MSFFSKEGIINFFGLSGNEEEYEEEYEEIEPQQKVVNEYEPIKAASSAYSTSRENQSSLNSQPSSYQTKSNNERKKVIAMHGTNSTKNESGSVQKSANKIIVLEPRVYSEAKDIAKCIIRNEVVIINFRVIEEKQARRIVDFLTGVVFGVDGDIQRIGDEIFVCTPANTEIDGTATKSLLDGQFFK